MSLFSKKPVLYEIDESQLNEVKQQYEKHKEVIKKHRKQFVQEIVRIIKKHYKTLETKYYQLAYKDDYGYIIWDDFIPEFRYFVAYVLMRELPSLDSYPELMSSYDEINKILDSSNASYHINDLYEDPHTFWCFTLSYKDLEKITEKDFHDNKLEMHLNFEIVDGDWEERDKACLLEDDKEISYVLYKIYELAFYLFIGIVTTKTTAESGARQTADKKRIMPDKPLEYEKYIADCLSDLGFSAKSTKASGDQGADVLAEKDGVSFAIQCKKYSHDVGNKAVQEANAGRDFYKCDYGVVVSNANFTKFAKQAAHACGIILLNDKQLSKLLEYIN